MIGLKRGTVKLLKPKAIWKQSFEREKVKLKKVFGKDLIDIQHIGSTAITGISAKPIIDIGLTAPFLERAKKYIPKLKKIGYNLKIEDRKDRLFFTKGTAKKRTHYLHIGEVGSDYIEGMVLFRNYLNRNKATSKEYAELKDKLAKQYPEERYIYAAKKKEFIESIVKKLKGDITS